MAILQRRVNLISRSDAPQRPALERTTNWSALRLCSAFASVFLFATTAQAWKWKDEPQPLLHQRAAIWSDADSPLAWDSSRRILWHLSSGRLTGAFWSRGTFVTSTVEPIVPNAKVGLLVDSGLHFLYFADASGTPHCLRPSGRDWRVEKIGDAPVTRFLAVDARKRGVFAYDAAAQGIRLFTYDAKLKAWSSSIIATGLGMAEEAGAYHAIDRVLYTTHEDVSAEVERHAAARSFEDPTGIGAWKPWPLVATAWNGAQWTSRVIDHTGVPQQPAVRLTDRRVFYAHHDKLTSVVFHQPSRPRRPEIRGTEEGWSGQDTFVDHSNYAIRAPQYPSSWSGFYGVFSERATFYFHSGPEIKLQGPITIVPYYEPVWTDAPLPARLARFRATISARQSRLVQHRLIARGEVVRKQTDQRLAGYLYRDANGVLAKQIATLGLVVQSYRGGFPSLGAQFDPANPPAHFGELARSDLQFSVSKDYTTLLEKGNRNLPWMHDYDQEWVRNPVPPHCSLDPAAPWVPAHLRLPNSVQTRTFGHSYRSPLLDQEGGRYRDFPSASTSLAAASQLAVDAPTGVTFYTQATKPRDNVPAWMAGAFPRTIEYSSPPLTGFSPEPERQWPASPQSVWIVMVY